MSEADPLQRYLAGAIPLVGAMQARVRVATHDTVVIGAPLAPNVNHQGTAFGGSIAALATLACWGWVWLRVGEGARIVVARSEVDYLKPVAGDFSARCDAPDPATRDAFTASLERKGRAKIALTAVVEDADGNVCARFEGTFAAKNPEP